MEKRQTLRWWDILIVTIILFGTAIDNSTYSLLYDSAEEMAEACEYSTMDNWLGILEILLELFVAFVYLKIRRFDFTTIRYQVTAKGTLLALGVYLLISIGMDLNTILFYGWEEATWYVGSLGILEALREIDLSLLAFSFINGIYEEVFFLGICVAVNPKYRMHFFIYSMIVRFSFHTYQGIPNAIGIGFVIGAIYYVLYRKRKDKNLYPYMLSHSLADIFGAGILPLL